MKMKEDCYISELKRQYNYEAMKSLLEKGVMELYKNLDKEHKTLYELDEKYKDHHYLKKISPLSYVSTLYDNLINRNSGGIIDCQLLHLPIYNLNGKAVQSPSKTPIIIIDFSLTVILEIMCHSFISYVYFISNMIDLEKENIDNETLLVEHVLKPAIAFIKYFFRNDFEEIIFPKQFSKNNFIMNNNATVLSRAMLLFIICHEQAHHELGHAKKAQFAFEQTKKDIDLIENSREREFDADRLGLKLFSDCIDVNSRFNLFRDLGSFIYSPLQFFCFLSILEHFKGAKKSTHPKAKERINNLLPLYTELFDACVPDVELEMLRSYSDHLLKLMENLGE